MHIVISDRLDPVFIRLDNLERRRQELAQTVERAQRVLEEWRERREGLHAMRYREGVERVR